MTTVFDVAAFIVQRTREITPLKLQKLVYYTQAWSLVRDGQPMFAEQFEAWRYGPVVPELYRKHPGMAFVPFPYPFGNPNDLSPQGQTTALAVVHVYGKKSPGWLSDLTHREDPWRIARGALPSDAWCDERITVESMRSYYESAESPSKTQVMAFGAANANSLINFMQSMSDDEASIVDELSMLDDDEEVAKLTAS